MIAGMLLQVNNELKKHFTIKRIHGSWASVGEIKNINYCMTSFLDMAQSAVEFGGGLQWPMP